MQTSFRHFMEGIIDYAGLFPPASLQHETALANYRVYLEDEHSWMLGRYIIPAAQLQRVALPSDIRFSVLVSPAMSKEEHLQIQQAARSVEMAETTIPAGTHSPGKVTAQLTQLHSTLKHAGCLDVQLFIECLSDVEQTAVEIAAFNNTTRSDAVIKEVGFKLRCGGATSEMFPTVEIVADVIGICRQYNIPIKFTAGMHQPIRNYERNIGVMQHGFINMFAAALFCWHHSPDSRQIADILNEEQPHNFIFTESKLQWRTFSISADEIQRLRRSRVISFGSCSFTEPREALSSLKLL